MSNVFVFRQPPSGFHPEYFGGGGKGGTTTQSVSIPPEVLARYNAVNARAEDTAKQPFQQYGGEFVAPLNPTQQAGVQATTNASQSAQPYFGAATGLTLSGAQDVGPLTQQQIGYYQNPAMLATLAPTQAALQQQQGQQLSQQQSEAIKGGAFGGDRAGLQRQALRGQQQLGMGQALAPIFAQSYQTALNTAQGQQGVVAADLARRMQAGQQIAGLGTGAQGAALQGAQAQMAAGQVQQQTQQAQDTAQYQQFLQERGYPFQVAQFLANIAMGTGALSGSTTTTQAPGGFFSDERLKKDIKEIGETHDGQPIYSYKYKNDDRTQIGLMAQDVEKEHPEAVGLLGGYKTVDYKKATEDAERTHKDMGGGLAPDGFDASSMGGAVMPAMSGEGFMRGGYVGGGLVGDTDWAQIIAANKAALGVYGGGQGPYGGAGAGGIGAGGIVPQGSVAVPKLVTAGSLPQQRPSGFSTALQTGKDIQSNYKGGKELLLGSAPTAEDKKGAAGLLGGQGELGGKNVFTKGKEAVEDFFKPATAAGGLIVPRHAYADGGETDNEVAPYDPAETMRGEDPMKDVLASGNKKYELQKPGQAPGGGGGHSLGIGKMAGSALGSAFGPVGSFLGGTLGSFLPFNEGGLVPRQAHKDGERAIPDYSEEADLPSAGAQEAGLVVERPDREKIVRTFLPINEQMESGGKNIGNPASSAFGPYQFTSDTFATVAARHPEVGYTAADHKNPDAQRALAPYHAHDLLNSFQKSGIDPSHQALRMGWAFGESGGPAFMKAALANPDAQGTSLTTPGVVKANPTWFFHKDGPNGTFGTPKTASETMNTVLGKFGSGTREAPVPPGLVGAGVDRSAAPAEGKKGLGETLTSEGFVVPALGFLGSMLASNRPNLGGALGEGILGGVGAYQGQQKQLADIAKTKAETGQMLPVATARNIEAANKLATGLMQYNASLPPGSPKLTLQQYAKVVGYTGPLPSEGEQTTGVATKEAKPAGGAPGEVKVAEPASRNWSFSPDEKETLVINYPDGTVVPASKDPLYLSKYADRYTTMGEGWAKEQADAARKAAEEIVRSGRTVDVKGNVVSLPGAIESGQKQKIGEGLAKEALEFNDAAQKYRPEAQNILSVLDDLGTNYSVYRSGPDAAARANFDRLMKVIDPDNRNPSIHPDDSWSAARYDKAVKDAFQLSIAQLTALSPRAPKAELDTLARTIPLPNLDAGAIQGLIGDAKARVLWNMKMHDAFDVNKDLNLNEFKKKFEKDTPFDKFKAEVKKTIPAAAGTQQQREQASAIPTIRSDEEYNAIKPGTTYIAPDGTTRRKP
jgi:hypothetical protein